MPYKTMALELLKAEYPGLHERLRMGRGLLEALDRYSRDFKEAHDRRKEELSGLRPGSPPAQIASEAPELAVEDLRAKFSAERSRDSTSHGSRSRGGA
jgi:hypothetical protein